MSDAKQNDSATSEYPRRGRNGRRVLRLGAVLLVGALAGSALTVSTGALARSGLWGHHGGHHGWHHGGEKSVEDVKDRAHSASEHVLNRVDATPEQVAQVKVVLDGLIEELYPLRAQKQSQRDVLVSALSGESVDVQALEAARLTMLDLAETASTELLQATTEIGEILDPEQRGSLVEMMERFRH